MAWTYSGDPASSNRDAVRFLVGDTLPADQQMQDAEIEYLIVQHGTAQLAAAAAAEALVARYARKVDVTDGDTSLRFSQRADEYRELAKTLREQRASGAAPLPYVGGVSISEVEAKACDTDRFPDVFSVGMHDYP